MSTQYLEFVAKSTVFWILKIEFIYRLCLLFFYFGNSFPPTSSVSKSRDIPSPGRASNTWLLWNVISVETRMRRGPLRGFSDSCSYVMCTWEFVPLMSELNEGIRSFVLNVLLSSEEAVLTDGLKWKGPRSGTRFSCLIISFPWSCRTECPAVPGPHTSTGELFWKSAVALSKFHGT